MQIKFLFKGENFSPEQYRSTYILKYPCQTHKECYPIESDLEPGYYLLEVWGAQGGSDGSKSGGKGGYSKGILKLSTPTKAFFYVGAEGTRAGDDILTDYSFNGGGRGSRDKAKDYYATSGGGASDVRLNEDTLYHRVIVAGGGGGATASWDG